MNTLYLYLYEVFWIETIVEMSHPFYALNVFRVYSLGRNLKTAMLNNTTFTNVTNSTNGTGAGPRPGPRPPPLPQVDVVAMVFFCILALMIVFGNSLVIAAFRVNRRLRTTTNLLLMSLAIADFLIGTVSVPLWVYISVTYTFQGPLYDFYLIFDVICGVSSIINLTAISLERCYALIHPIKHRNIRKRKLSGSHNL